MVINKIALKKWLTPRNIVISAIVVFLLWPMNIVGSHFNDITAIRHQDELFVVIEQEYFGCSLPRCVMYPAGCLGLLTYDSLRRDTIIYHLKDRTLTKSYIKNAGYFSSRVSGKKLYFEGGNSVGRYWVWNGTGLTPITTSVMNAHVAKNAPSPDSGFNTNSGWEKIERTELSTTKPNTRTKKNKPIQVNTEKITPIPLGNLKYQMIFRRTPDDQEPVGESYSLAGVGLALPEQPLYDWKQNETLVSLATYRKISNHE